MRIEEFIRFLKDNDAYLKYITNIKNQHPEYLEGNKFSSIFIDKFSRLSYSIIDFTLYWANTKEGHEYWRDLHRMLRTVEGLEYYKTR